MVDAATNLRGAKLAAERLRVAIENFDFTGIGKVTASIGISLVGEGDDDKTLVKRADQAMYKAKAEGRNRIVANLSANHDHVEVQPAFNAESVANDQLNKALSTETILVVDDDHAICEYISLFAEHHGFGVDTVHDAVNFASTYRVGYSAILLDLNMPDTDGIELLRFLSENKCKSQIAFISNADMSILNAAENITRNYGLNVIGAFKKPLNEDLMANLFKKLKDTIAFPIDGGSDILLNVAGTAELPGYSDLKFAIENDGLDVYFQPKIRLEDLSFAGVEALVRWNHPEKGFIPPDYFVQFAEAHDLIEELTDFVVHRICKYCQDWSSKWQPFGVSINISEKNLEDLELPEKLSGIIKGYDLPPSRFTIEVTETSFGSNPANALDVLTRLRLKGFQLSIDDFGTGHSSLARLRQMPFSELKIDKMFVDGCDFDRDNRAIVSNTINLGHSLGMKTVAEGVENEAQLNFLREQSVDEIQGYYFSQALPTERLDEWLKDHWR